MPAHFATLGELKLELFSGPSAWSRNVESALVEHKVAEGKPVLEWTGDELGKIDLEIMLDALYCEPEAVAARLEEMRASRTAHPLTRGDGFGMGDWAVKSIKNKLEVADKSGKPVRLGLTVALIEAPPQQKIVQGPPSSRSAALPAPAVAAAPKVKTETITNPDGVSFSKIVRTGAPT